MKIRNIQQNMFFLLFILLSITVFITPSSYGYSNKYKISNLNNWSPSAPMSLQNTYVPHEPIIIEHESNFTDYGIPGSGTETSPYIIEGYNITTIEYEAIRISSIFYYVVVRNCYLNADLYGINMGSSNEGSVVIENNYIEDNNFGIYVSYLDSAEINNNTCKNNWKGIQVEYVDELDVHDNYCFSKSGVQDCGIYIANAPYATITENVCLDAWKGFYFDHCGSSMIKDNLAYYNVRYGMEIYSSNGATVIDNQSILSGKYGFYFYSFGSHVIKNNYADDHEYGIYIKSSASSIIENNFCELNDYGIFLESSTSTKVQDNKVSMSDYGIQTVTTDSAIIANNTCYYNDISILIVDSDSISIANNTHYNNTIGIQTDSSSYSEIRSNNCSFNVIGINLIEEYSSEILENICYQNTQYGIKLSETSSCDFHYNIIQENTDYGLYIDGTSSNNFLTHNSFIDNKLGYFSQAYDAGAANDWFNGIKKEGNYWSNLGENETYEIAGPAGSIDFYPLDENLEKPSASTYIMLCLALVSISWISLRVKKRKKD